MKLILLTIGLFCPFWLLAQYTSDAFLFGETQALTNARSIGVGNTLGALGADMSVININPAGLGVYRRSEISISAGGLFDNTKNNFQTARTTSKDRMSQLTFGNIGLAIAIPTDDGSDWKFVNIGISVNQLANFSRNVSYDGITEGSRILSFVDAAQGIAPDNLNAYESRLAYNAFLIDEDVAGSGNYTSPVIASDQIAKSQSVQRRGGIHEFGLSLSANYKNKLYIGATIGIPILQLKDFRYYQEAATNDTIPFEAMSFSEERVVKGVGLNLKLGMIYRINKNFRFGLAVHTPTAYSLTETFDTEIYGKLWYGSTLKENTLKPDKIQSLKHKLNTPWVFASNLGIVIGKGGFIGMEVSYKDYSLSEFSLYDEDLTISDKQYMRNLNRSVIKTYQGTLNAKIGAELVLDETRLRVGYQFQTSPYTQSVPNVNDFRHDISAGVGFRWKNVFLDFAYVHTLRNFEYIPYSSPQQQRIVSNQQTGVFMITLGSTFLGDD